MKECFPGGSGLQVIDATLVASNDVRLKAVFLISRTTFLIEGLQICLIECDYHIPYTVQS